MRDIKEYIHLYLWCKCVITDNKQKSFTGTLTPTDLSDLFAEIIHIKPVLRKLPSMTEEEKIRVYLWEYPNYKSGELVKNDSDNYFFVIKNENGMRCNVNLHHFSAETTRKLLEAGFDLFGLIESGMAIDQESFKINKP